MANTESERQIRERLLSLLGKHKELEKWTFAEALIIRDDGFSHSYPDLTLATNQLLNRSDSELVSIYVHENLHCFLSQHPENFHATMRDLQLKYPKVPVGRAEGGAKDEHSSYIHLIVCYLEYIAMIEIFGKERALEILGSHDYYRWIYKTVLEDTHSLGTIMEKNGLTPSPVAK